MLYSFWCQIFDGYKYPDRDDQNCDAQDHSGIVDEQMTIASHLHKRVIVGEDLIVFSDPLSTTDVVGIVELLWPTVYLQSDQVEIWNKELVDIAG